MQCTCQTKCWWRNAQVLLIRTFEKIMNFANNYFKNHAKFATSN